jgi:hypothetical protein
MRVSELLCQLFLVGIAIVTFVTAARNEDFWWADGASFALNGELIRDYLASGLGRNPMVFAQEWFRHYPALTISLYPPIFPLVEAVVFAIFGFSHPTALATVTMFAAVASFGIYRTVRTAVGVLPATAAGIMLLATPEVLRWSREIVMDVPAMALLLLAATALLHYQATKRTRTLLVAVLLTLAAIYTKQTAIFVVPAFAVSLLADDGWALARRKSTWQAVAGFVIGLLPLAVFTLLFATENFHIAFGAGTGQKGYDRLSVQALTAYARVLPEIVGIIPLVGSGAYLALLGVKGWHDNAERRLTVLMVSWFVIDYLLISVTADFETRYAVPLTVPPVVLSVLLLTRLLSPTLSGSVALVASVGMFAALISSQPVTRVEGYGDVAQYVLDQTAPGDVVLFHGMGSKNFTFAVRSRSPTPKIFIERAEKLLVDYSIMREWGITDRNISVADLEAIIDRDNITHIIFQPNFWTDQPSIARLQWLIDTGRYRLVAQFFVTSDDISRCVTLRVYRVIHGSPTEGDSIELVIPPLEPL